MSWKNFSVWQKDIYFYCSKAQNINRWLLVKLSNGDKGWSTLFKSIFLDDYFFTPRVPCSRYLFLYFFQIDLQWMVMNCDPTRPERETCDELPVSNPLAWFFEKNCEHIRVNTKMKMNISRSWYVGGDGRLKFELPFACTTNFMPPRWRKQWRHRSKAPRATWRVHLGRLASTEPTACLVRGQCKLL
jgi:hypothetical protein